MNQDEQEIQVSTAEQRSEYEAVPTGQDGKREKQKKKKSGFGKGFAVGAVTMAVVCGVMFWATSGLGLCLSEAPVICSIVIRSRR